MEDLGIKHTDVALMVVAHPKVLTYSLSKQIRGISEFIRGFGPGLGEVGAAVRKHPEVFGIPKEEYKPVVSWLRDLSGIHKPQVPKP